MKALLALYRIAVLCSLGFICYCCFLVTRDVSQIRVNGVEAKCSDDGNFEVQIKRSY